MAPSSVRVTTLETLALAAASKMGRSCRSTAQMNSSASPIPRMALHRRPFRFPPLRGRRRESRRTQAYLRCIRGHPLMQAYAAGRLTYSPFSSSSTARSTPAFPDS